MKKNIKKIIITTPIYYPNSNLHIGHAYTTALSDILARFRKLEGVEVLFVTGSDEHGQKLYDKAKEFNKDTLTYIDEIVFNFKKLWNDLDINYDVFIRTTDEIHKNNVQKIFSLIQEKGFIYKGFYKGFYCKNDESYFSKSQLIEEKCPQCNREVSIFEEESYFLKIKEFQKWIKDVLVNEDIIIPKTRIKELLNSFIDANLEDLSISRKNFEWGIKIPNDNNFVIYVWFDALINYLSALLYPETNFKLEDWNDESTEIVQFLGKEIIRFHAIYWPIILNILGYKLPKLLSHGWLVVNGEKMSKSLGNIVDPIEVIKVWGSDALRFYLIKNISFGSDGKFSEELLKNLYNGILVNKYSNLINRTFKMNEKYFQNITPNGNIFTSKGKEFIEHLSLLEEKIINSLDKYDFNLYANLIVEYLDRMNLYIDETSPWKETDEETLKEIIWSLINKIYALNVLISPILTKASRKIFDFYNINTPNFKNLNLDFKNLKLPSELILFERKV